MSWELLDKVSPQSRSTKRFVKLPMVLNNFSAALLAAISVAVVKIITELIVCGTVLNYWFIFFPSVVFVLAAMGLNQYKMAQTQMFYQQLEAIPIYQGCTMLGQTIAGNLIFKEMAGASSKQIYVKIMGILLVLIGIKCLTSKQQYNQKIKMERKRRES